MKLTFVAGEVVEPNRIDALRLVSPDALRFAGVPKGDSVRAVISRANRAGALTYARTDAAFGAETVGRYEQNSLGDSA